MKTRLLILLKSVDGGTGTYLEGLLGMTKLYPKNNLDVKVMVLESPKYRTANVENYTFLYNSDANRSIKYKINLRTGLNFIKELSWFLFNVEEFKPNVVLASDSHSILISQISKSIFNKDYKTIGVIQNNIVRVIEYKIKKSQRYFVKKILSVIFRKTNLVITVSNDLSKSVYSKFNLKNIPITIEAILPLRVNTDKLMTTKPRKNIIVSVARFDAQKDHKTLIDAFGFASSELRNSELWLIGDGPTRIDMERYVKKNKMSHKVKFMGWIQDPISTLSSASAFVLSSNWEGFPLTLLEAMTIGIPVIATDCDFGPREILGENKYGLIVPTGDKYKMAKSIIELINNSKKWNNYSTMAKIRAKNYDSRIMLRKFKNNLDYLMSKTIG